MSIWTKTIMISAVLSLAACDGAKNSTPKTDYSAPPKNFSKAVNWKDIKPGSAQYHFLAGGFETLSAVEHILQTRYNNYSGELPMMPGGQSNLGFNPEAAFDPAFIEIALKGALEHLAIAQNSLSHAVGRDFAIDVDIGELWLDINSNGIRDKNEGLIDMVVDMPGFRNPSIENTIVRFDTADADWLAAYTHVLAGSAELILSVDPTPAIKTITDGRKLMEEKGIIKKMPWVDRSSDARELDTIAAAIAMLRGKPDAERTNAALKHFQSMIKHNKAFWKALELETDNEREWLPNAQQKSVFGVDVDAQTAAGWQNVLSEVSDVLEGNTLLPYWRVERGSGNKDVGINFNELMKNPSDFDIALFIHGASIAPFLEEGKVADMQAWRDFARLTGGRSGLFALWLN